MSFYQQIAKTGQKFISKEKLFKIGFNLSPLYRRSTARIIEVTEDISTVKVRLKISWKNRNYVGSIFGGSMFAAVDPVYMVQLINLIGEEYVVWDKSAQINFKRPAKEDLYATFQFTAEELEQIKADVENKKEIEIQKTSLLTNKQGDTVFCEVHKIIYVADKSFYKQKRKAKKQQ